MWLEKRALLVVARAMVRAVEAVIGGRLWWLLVAVAMEMPAAVVIGSC